MAEEVDLGHRWPGGRGSLILHGDDEVVVFVAVAEACLSRHRNQVGELQMNALLALVDLFDLDPALTDDIAALVERSGCVDGRHVETCRALNNDESSDVTGRGKSVGEQLLADVIA